MVIPPTELVGSGQGVNEQMFIKTNESVFKLVSLFIFVACECYNSRATWLWKERDSLNDADLDHFKLLKTDSTQVQQIDFVALLPTCLWSQLAK